jgi:hypothetical protein
MCPATYFRECIPGREKSMAIGPKDYFRPARAPGPQKHQSRDPARILSAA